MNRTYHFLDVRFSLDAPDELLDMFECVYGHFREACECKQCSASAHPEISLTAESDGESFLFSGPTRQVTIARDDALAYLLYTVQNTVVRASRAYFMIHGAALDIDGRGVVLTASSGLGKTTLCLELVRQGAGFLSDEIAAVPIAGGPLHAFPRAVGIREKTFDLLGLDPPENEATIPESCGFKQFLDVQAAFCQSPPGNVPLSAVVFLAPPPDPTPTDTSNEWLELSLHGKAEPNATSSNRGSSQPRPPKPGSKISLEGEAALSRLEHHSEPPALKTDALLSALRATPGIHEVFALEDRDEPVLRIGYEPGLSIIDAVDRAAIDSRTVIRGHHRGRSLPPDYTAEAAILNLGAREGLERVMSATLNLRDMSGTLAQLPMLYLTMGKRTAGTAFKEMTVGSLRSEVDLLTRR
ncbi:MAG: hypothetical protein HQ559_02650 [Lentisphaerae bacterium]|nr:hypothetical protein [Lentisphaerota bacterium]